MEVMKIQVHTLDVTNIQREKETVPHGLENIINFVMLKIELFVLLTTSRLLLELMRSVEHVLTSPDSGDVMMVGVLTVCWSEMVGLIVQIDLMRIN